MLYNLAGLKTQKERRFEAATHQKYIGSKRRTNNKFSWIGRFLFQRYFLVKMYTVEPRYNELLCNEVLGIRNCFLTLVMVKYMAIWKRTSIKLILSQKRTSLQRTYFASPLALRYIEVPLYLILLTFLFFKKWWGWGGAAPQPPSPSPCAGLARSRSFSLPNRGKHYQNKGHRGVGKTLPRVFTWWYH